MMRASLKNHKNQGFTYIGLLFAVAIMGVCLALVAQLWSTLDRRDKERQLLFIGAEFRDALTRYYQGTPPGARPQYPASLDDLLRDRRYPDIRRYLRKIYADPFTGKAQWGLVKANGAITGIYSLAAGVPIKSANFDYGFQFANAKSYAQWIFGDSGAGAAGSIALTTAAPGPANPVTVISSGEPGAQNAAANNTNDTVTPQPTATTAATTGTRWKAPDCVMTFDPVKVQVFCKKL